MNNIKIFAMDVDGTMTDGKIYIGATGEIMKAFNVKDGFGIRLLHESGVVPVIITGRKSTIVEERAKELNIVEVHQDVDDKLEVLKSLCKKYQVSISQVAFVGDDLNDINVMKRCGISFCPSDATASVMNAVDCVLTVGGGEGAIREAIERILNCGL